jgi:hypothetical protein
MACFGGNTSAAKGNIRSAATSFDKTIFRELRFERIDCSLTIRGRLRNNTAAGDEVTVLVGTDRKGNASMGGRSGKVERSNRPAAFATLTNNSFQFPRQKGWKILLFERLALFL